MDDLETLRDKIDEIDVRLVALLNERAEAAKQIGAIKAKLGAPVYVPSRERALLQKLESANAGPLPNRSVRAIYREIMSASLDLENGFAVAVAGDIFGPAGAAAQSKFGSSVRYLSIGSTRAILDMLEKNHAHCCVAGVSADPCGSSPALDLLASGGIRACALIPFANDRFYVLCRVSGDSPEARRSIWSALLREDEAEFIFASFLRQQPYPTFLLGNANDKEQVSRRRVFFEIEAADFARLETSLRDDKFFSGRNLECHGRFFAEGSSA